MRFSKEKEQESQMSRNFNILNKMKNNLEMLKLSEASSLREYLSKRLKEKNFPRDFLTGECQQQTMSLMK